MEESKKKVSIIIPVYQVKDTLRECVRSCLGQKAIDPGRMEIILVDDGSTDESGEICDELAREGLGGKKIESSKDVQEVERDPEDNDKQIRVFHTENHGVSHARNVGIDEANGKYVVFVDSDDVVKDGFLETLLKFADEDTVLVDETDSIEADARISGVSYIENSVLNRNTHVWGKLFSLEVLRDNGIRFREGLTIGEDLLFLLDFALSQEKRHTIRCIPAGDYVYRENEQGAMKRAFRESYLDEIRCWRMAEEMLLPYSRELSRYAFVSVAVSQIMTAFLVAGKIAVMDDTEIDEELRNRAVLGVEEQIKHALKTQGAFAALPAGHKIKTLIFRLNKDLYLRMYGAHKKR